MNIRTKKLTGFVTEGYDLILCMVYLHICGESIY